MGGGRGWHGEVGTRSPHSAPVDTSECAHEVGAFIRDSASLTARCVPPCVFARIWVRVFEHLSRKMMNMLSSSAIGSWNFLAMVRLNADVKCLERVACQILKRGKRREAETQALADGFAEEGEGAAAKDLFADLAQMVDYVLRCVPESILDEQVRASLYPRLDLRKLSMLLMKYADP